MWDEGGDSRRRTETAFGTTAHVDESTDAEWGATNAAVEHRTIDLEFEWHQLCHGCGERKWFNAVICDDCRRRHDV